MSNDILRPEFLSQTCGLRMNCCQVPRLLREQATADAHKAMDAVMAKVADRSLSRDVAEAIRKNGGVPEKPKRSLPVVPSEPIREVRVSVTEHRPEPQDIVFGSMKLTPVRFTSMPPMEPMGKDERERLLKVFGSYLGIGDREP